MPDIEESAAGELLYHYCSTDTFHAIVKPPASIRLSALSMSNDSEEGRLLLRLIDQLGEQKQTNPSTLAALKARWNEVADASEGLAFCLSEEADLLSQWWGYADQGHGVSIGFSKSYLEGMSVATEDDANFAVLEKVEYDEAIQMREFEGTFDALVTATGVPLSSLLEPPAVVQQKMRSVFDRKMRRWTTKMYTFKNSGFLREAEWRMLTVLSKDELEICDFRPTTDKLVAFRTLALINGVGQAIRRVVLGPKHTTPEHLVKQFLRSRGLHGVEVVRSKLTYR